MTIDEISNFNLATTVVGDCGTAFADEVEDMHNLGSETLVKEVGFGRKGVFWGCLLCKGWRVIGCITSNTK
jgi:hypothetical protein